MFHVCGVALLVFSTPSYIFLLGKALLLSYEDVAVAVNVNMLYVP
jgi:hypothetical protein